MADPAITDEIKNELNNTVLRFVMPNKSICVQFSESSSKDQRDHLRMTEFWHTSVNQPITEIRTVVHKKQRAETSVYDSGGVVSSASKTDTSQPPTP